MTYRHRLYRPLCRHGCEPEPRREAKRSTRSGSYQAPHAVLYRVSGAALGILAMSRGNGIRARASRSKTRILGVGIDAPPDSKIGAAQRRARRPAGVDPVGAGTCAAWSAGHRCGSLSLMTHLVEEERWSASRLGVLMRRRTGLIGVGWLEGPRCRYHPAPPRGSPPCSPEHPPA